MTDTGRTRHALLSTPLYVCNLPTPLVQNVQLRSADAEEEKAPAPAPTHDPRPAAGVPACTLCPECGPFADLGEQRAHFRSLWHRYNLVLRQRGAQAPGTPNALTLVTNPELDRLCAQIEEEDELEDTDTLSALLDRLDLHAAPTQDDTPSRTRTQAVQDALRSPLVWFESRSDAPSDARLEQTQLGVYRDVLLAATTAPATDAKSAEAALQALQASPIECRPSKQGWTGKRLQGTKHIGRTMQLSILDGAGLLPTEEEFESSDEESSESDSSSEDEAPDEMPEIAPEAPIALPPLRLWTFVMMGGGHFAAAVVALNAYAPPLSERARARGTKQERGIVVLAHKTFHRYTTRRKQGGAQSAQDATGRHAKSAGANLRRHGEAQLRDEIHSLLGRAGWRSLIERSEHVWVRCSTRTASGILWNWGGNHTSPLDAPHRDGTLSHIPIATQRPTLAEIMRCFLELTRVKIAHLSPEQLAAQDDAHREAIAQALRADAAANAPPPPPPKPKTPRAKPRAEETKRRERWERLVAMVRKGKVDALERFLERHEADLLRPGGWLAEQEAPSIDAPLPPWWRQAEAKQMRFVPATLLQVAAAADQPDALQYLLERRADPTMPVPSVDASEAPYRTAYDLCTTKPARTVFRRMMAEHPDWCDWAGMGPGGARVPSALTSEMEEAQASKARTRRNAMRDKMRERDEKEAREQSRERAAEPAPPAPAAAPPAANGTQRVGGVGSAPDATLSPEMRMRIEREKRARAAEARMQALKKS